jgi:signal transduction histidine kinase
VREQRPPLTKRLRPGHWMTLDFLMAAVMGLSSLVAGVHGNRLGALPVAGAFALIVFLSVGLRRLRPVLAFGALAVLNGLGTVSPRIAIDGVVPLAMAYVLYMVTVASSRRASVIALAVGLAEIVGVSVAIHYHRLPDTSAAVFLGTLAMVIAWLTGYSVRQRRAYVEMLQVQAASSAVAQERLRIARELHDVVAHSMSVVAVQAGFGQYVIDESPADAREALGAIQATSREALAELRRMLGVLRQQDSRPDPGASAAPLAPEPGLGELPRLIERTRGAGIDVSLIQWGTVREVPAGIGVSAYRIIQEALTNIVRHAGSGARADVIVGHGYDSLRIEVTDDGGSPASLAARSPGSGHGSGHGLIGMRERVQLCAGELEAGPLPTGGFRVFARLPVPALPAPAAASAAAPMPTAQSAGPLELAR